MTTDPRNDLERLIITAARTRLRPWWKRHAILTGSIAALAIAAPATAAISGVWAPATGPAPTITAIAAPGGCTSTQDPRPTTTAAALPKYVTDAFSVLRTPRRDDDRPRLPADLISDGAAIDAARRVGEDDDAKPYYLVPVVSHNRADLVPDDCLQQLSSNRRRAAERQNDRIRSAPPTWKLCVFGPTSGGCDRARRVTARGSTGSVGTPQLGLDSTLRDEHGLVPDGVSSVRVSYRDGSSRTFDVHRNFYIYRVDAGPGLAGSIGAPTVTWLDRAGNTVSQPTP